MNLHDAFARLGPQIGIDARTLDAYACEDTVGGYHKDPALARWPAGSVFEVEGQFLYALVRALKPATVVEVGVYSGCSTTHILSALRMNGAGKLHSYDFEYPGWLVPTELKGYWRFVKADAFEALVAEPIKADMCWEDAFHDARTGEMLKLLLAACNPKVLVSHDAEHFSVGPMVRRGWDETFGQGKYEHILVNPSDCGLAYKVLR